MILCWLLDSSGLRAAPAGAQQPSIEQASAKEKKAALEHYRDGMAAFDKGNYQRALARFRESFATVASPNSLLMVGRCLRRTGNAEEAYRTLETTVNLAEELSQSALKYKPTAEAAQKELGELRSENTVIHLTVPVNVSVNGEPLSPDQWSLPLVRPPGKITLVLESGDHKVTREIEGAKGTVARAELAPRAAAPAAPPLEAAKVVSEAREPDGIPHSTLAYASAGIAVVGAAGFTVFGLMNNAAHDDLARDCPEQRCPEERAADAETGRRLQTWANVSLGVGVTGALGALLFWLTTPASAPAPENRASIDVNIGPTGAQLSGSF